MKVDFELIFDPVAIGIPMEESRNLINNQWIPACLLRQVCTGMTH